LPLFSITVTDYKFLATRAASDDIQVGFPVLPEATHPMRFDLLRAWLRRCDKEHACNDHDLGHEKVFSTRLLFVGNLNTDILSICTTTQLGDKDYVALSHCWGNLSEEEKRKVCTTVENFRSRQKGFRINDLPRSFRDAIQVTRELGQQYLWIDSLCILQDDKKDWEHEAKHMEDVFSSAYCVIAASSACSSREGFLQRDIGCRYVQITDASGRRIYVCADMDDFEDDVNKSRLNTRGWVLQERALSRRTVHFTTKCTYWECGGGVFCENLNALQR
jgi:Heterokaryon incompatibility protein (HET)